MSLKKRLFALISAFTLVFAMLIVSVWAVTETQLSVDGNISFITSGITATISQGQISGGSWVNASDANHKMKGIVINSDKTTSQIEKEFLSWQGIKYNFNENGDDISIAFTVTNNSTVANEFIQIIVNVGGDTMSNATTSINTSGTTLSPNGGSQEFVITYSIIDKNEDASISGFEIDIDMKLSNSPIRLNHDTTNDYYYVEMGTYNDKPVRWKVVAVDGSPYVYNESTAPTGELAFILETHTTAYIFGDFPYPDEGTEEYNAMSNNDYSTCALRQYLTGHDCALTWDGNDMTVSGNYLNDIKIDETNEIYKYIKARSIEDLYQGMGTPKTTVGSDKLWIPSLAETTSLIGQNNLLWLSGVSYFLRSPAAAGYVDYVFTYEGQGATDWGRINEQYPVRPMFLLQI